MALETRISHQPLKDMRDFTHILSDGVPQGISNHNHICLFNRLTYLNLCAVFKLNIFNFCYISQLAPLKIVWWLRILKLYEYK